METWVGQGEVGRLFPFRLGLASTHRTACFCFIGWGSVETALKGKAPRFSSLKDMELGDLEGSKFQEALHGMVTKHRLGDRQPGFKCHGYH